MGRERERRTHKGKDRDRERRLVGEQKKDQLTDRPKRKLVR